MCPDLLSSPQGHESLAPRLSQRTPLLSPATDRSAAPSPAGQAMATTAQAESPPGHLHMCQCRIRPFLKKIKLLAFNLWNKRDSPQLKKNPKHFKLFITETLYFKDHSLLWKRKGSGLTQSKKEKRAFCFSVINFISKNNGRKLERHCLTETEDSSYNVFYYNTMHIVMRKTTAT